LARVSVQSPFHGSTFGLTRVNVSLASLILINRMLPDWGGRCHF